MSSPNDSVEISNIESGSMSMNTASDDILTIPEVTEAMSGETKETATVMSTVTFPSDSADEFGSIPISKKDSAGVFSTGAATERTAGGTRKINRHDVKQIFRGSTTTGTITMEQLLRIKNMHEKIESGVDMDFNYSCLLIIASVIAGLGLASDSTTTVISSMLLSPIMGPVIGMSYGLVIWDLPLIKRSARNEIFSVIICVALGFIIGFCCHWTLMAQEWPTQEMLSRGTRTTFLCGFPIAFFSGLGVALSVLDDQTSSLVGVAISASLLPPAVNCGMMFVVAILKGEDWSQFSFQYESTYPDFVTQIGEIVGEAPKFHQVGILSLLLTVANVIMVALGSCLMFRAKEVLPVKKKVFWEDLKIARRIYQGRAVDPVTGEALTAEDFIAAFTSELAEGGVGDFPISKHSGTSKQTQ